MASLANVGSAVEVSQGASYLTVQYLITAAAQAVTFAVLARILTPSEVGILAVLMLVTGFSWALIGGAFQQAAIKYVGEFAHDEREIALGVFYQTVVVSLVFSIPIAVIIFVGATTLAHSMLGSGAQASLFQILSFDILVYSGLLPSIIGITLGLKRFKECAIIGTAGVLVRQILIILLVVLIGNLVGLVYAWLISDVVLSIAYWVYLVHEVGWPRRTFSLRRLIDFSWPLSIGYVVSFCYSSFDRAILIVFVPLSSLGVYNAALMAFGVLGSVSNAVSYALLPVYSAISWSQNRRRATRLASRYISLAVVPLAFGLMATARPALTLFVGRAYVGGALPLAILAFVFGVTVFGMAVGPMLTALARTRTIMWITVASVLLGLGSAYVLLPILGITGASLARGLSLLLFPTLTVVVLRRMRAMELDSEAVWKSLVAGGIMVCALVALQLLFQSPILLPAYVMLGAIVYLLALRELGAVRRSDIDFMGKVLGSRLGFVSRVLSLILIGEGLTGTPLKSGQ